MLLGSPEGIVFNHGTVIFNPDAPRFAAAADWVSPGLLRVEIPTLKQNWYQWERSRSLLAGSWESVGDAFEGDGTLEGENFLISGDTTSMFFRAKWLPFEPATP